MEQNPAQLSQDEYDFMLYKLGQAGSFRTALYEAWFAADLDNSQKLESVFPELEVVRRYSNEDGYWENLCQRWNQTQSKV